MSSNLFEVHDVTAQFIPFASSTFFGFGFGGGIEWAVIGGVALLLFGGKKLPGLARSLGQSVTEFKQGINAKPKDDSDAEKRLTGSEEK
ncbi:MAG: twin-arginine translocase TatA/TatE family subunit [Planctomycetota bacterium]